MGFVTPFLNIYFCKIVDFRISSFLSYFSSKLLEKKTCPHSGHIIGSSSSVVHSWSHLSHLNSPIFAPLFEISLFLLVSFSGFEKLFLK